MGSCRTRKYRAGVLEAENFPVDQVSECLLEDEVIVWVDLAGPSTAELGQLAHELGLHELAVEDALGRQQRPKVDRYPTHLYLSVQAVAVDHQTAELAEMEIDAFISDRWFITVRQDPGFPIDSVVARWDRSSDLAKYGSSFLLYGLLDVVVDGYFETVDCFDEFYDEVSELIFSEHQLQPEQQRHWFQMRRALARFHRLAVPTREAVSALMRHEHTAVAEELYPYFQDVYDHILRVSESTDSLRDLVSTIVETNLSLRDYRQNQIMKKVTSWAGIIAVPTLITGYYGMNVPYPGALEPWGAWLATLLSITASASLYVIFRRKEWL